jgi:hypothetical protein
MFLLQIRADEEQALDNDISYEFHRESHHIHSIPRTEISQVLTVLIYGTLRILFMTEYIQQRGSDTVQVGADRYSLAVAFAHFCLGEGVTFEVEFLDISLTKDLRLLLHAIHTSVY